MCFCKTRQSKVLRAKRDIVVYKIGVEANKAIFTPYFMTKFSYIAGIKNTTDPNFNISHIEEGFHGYINIALTITVITPVSAVIQKNTKREKLYIFTISNTNYIKSYIYVNTWEKCLKKFEECTKEGYNNALDKIGKHFKD